MKINKGTNQLVSAFRVFTKQYDAQYDAETVSDWGEIELKVWDAQVANGRTCAFTPCDLILHYRGLNCVQ
jgi:hypothetical protein